MNPGIVSPCCLPLAAGQPHLPAVLAPPRAAPRGAGLGRKSVGCIMLLTLNKKEFPVDTNVGRICARWAAPPRPHPIAPQPHLGAPRSCCMLACLVAAAACPHP